MRRIIFWGVGNIGSKIYEFTKKYGEYPDYWCDNDSLKWGTEKSGKTIISPQEVDYEQDVIFITCASCDAIEKQILELGGKKSNIIYADREDSDELIAYMSEQIARFAQVHRPLNIHWREGILFDLSGGLVLGGVERWCFQSAQMLSDNNVQGGYLVPINAAVNIQENTFEVIRTGDIEDCINKILNCGYRCIVCNFPFEIMMAACIIKRYIAKDLKIILAIHNDHEKFYKMCELWNPYIDEFWIISDVIEKKMMDIVSQPNKMKRIGWNVGPVENKKKEYFRDSKIRIGYAGRLTKTQKRVDLLIELAISLKKRKVDYILEIAGCGDAYDMLNEKMKWNSLEDSVILLGMLPHNEINHFWQDKDVYISCSEYEGHSISQVEAMSCGAVPVVTNTSGTSDDIVDGYNGFIVPIRDVEGLAEKVEYLYSHPEDISKFGQRAKQKIQESMDNYDNPFERIFPSELQRRGIASRSEAW